MESHVQKYFASLLRAAAAQAIPENDFWKQFDALVDPVRDPVAALAFESATHYWGNFHERNIFFMRVEGNSGQLEQGRNELNLIADALDCGWPLSELERELKDI